MISSPVICRRFIGRQANLTMLRERLAAAAAGAGSIALITGEAGMGKTRLITEFTTRPDTSSVRTMVGHCFEYASAPFAPFIEILRPLRDADPSLLLARPDLRRALARLLPESEETSDNRQANPAADKLTQMNAVVETLRCFVVAKPLCLVIEDVHWADPGTFEMLLHVAAAISGMRLFLVATARNDELEASRPVRSFAAKLNRYPSIVQCNLEPLNDTEMRELLRIALDGRSVPALDILEVIRKRAEGNPLNAEELLRSAVEQSPKSAGESLPPSYREAVLDRFERLRGAARTVLATAAAVGRSFDVDFLAQTAGFPRDAVIAALKKAIALQIVIEDAEKGDHYAFRHALTRDVIAGESLAAERRHMHAQIAAALEMIPDARDRLSELAYHTFEARDLQKAAAFNESAGDNAVAVYAFDDAAIFYDRALAALEDAGNPPPALHRKLAAALSNAGFGPRAVHEYHTAISAYESSGDFANAVFACLALCRLMWNMGDAQAAQTLAERALSLALRNEMEGRPSGPERFAAQVLLGGILCVRGNPRSGLAELDAAERFTDERYPEDLHRLYVYRAGALTALDRAADARQAYEKAIQLAVESGNPSEVVACYGGYVLAMATLGDRQAARSAIDRSLAIMDAEKVGGRMAGVKLAQYAFTCLLFGELQRARELIMGALDQVIDESRFRINAASIGLMVGLRLGDHELIERCAQERLIEEAFTLSQDMVFLIAAAFADYYAAGSRRNEAAALLHKALVVCAPPVDPEEFEMFVRIARYGDAEDLSPALNRMQNTVAVGRVRDAYSGLVNSFVARREGRRGDSTETAERAASLFHELHWPLHEAQALELAERRTDALALYRRIDATIDARRLQTALTPVNRRGRPKDQLTAREREVAALVTAGKGNRDIAEMLIIGERTVEAHVTAILNKLGVQSRAEVAGRLNEREPEQS